MIRKILTACVLILSLLLYAGCKREADNNGGSSNAYTPAMLLPSPTPILPSRTVEYSTLNFKEIWRFRTGFPIAVPFTSSPGLYVANRKVAIAFDIRAEPPIGGTLVALWLENGQIAWQTYIKDRDSSIGSFRLDREAGRLYLLYGFGVHAFDFETGKGLWSTGDLGGHTGYVFTPDSTLPLQLRSSRQELIAVDAETGEVLSRRKDPDRYTTLHYNSLSITKQNGSIVVTDRAKEQLLWQIDGWHFNLWPTFVEDDLLLQMTDRTSGPQLPNTIWRVNASTGKLIWGTPPQYVSNYAMAGNLLYALNQDGRLVALDLNNGTVIGEMKFNYPANDPAVLGSFRSYWVAVEGPYLLVYFGDSQELIAFKQDH